MNEFIAIAIVLISVFADGMRDGNIKREVDWLTWHVVKWISVYSAWGAILWFGNVQFILWVPVAIMSLILWRIGNKIKIEE